MIKQIQKFIRKNSIIIHKIQAHKGIERNEDVDQLAKNINKTNMNKQLNNLPSIPNTPLEIIEQNNKRIIEIKRNNELQFLPPSLRGKVTNNFKYTHTWVEIFREIQNKSKNNSMTEELRKNLKHRLQQLLPGKDITLNTTQDCMKIIQDLHKNKHNHHQEINWFGDIQNKQIGIVCNNLKMQIDIPLKNINKSKHTTLTMAIRTAIFHINKENFNLNINTNNILLFINL